MGVVLTDNWGPTVAKPTRVLNVGAGVTPRVGVQITNNTTAEIWLLDSSIPPGDRNQAKFIVPPRCTATYPLDSSTMSARWNGTLDTTGDSVNFVFTDEPTTPQVWPGIIPTGGTSSPVQTVNYNRSLAVIPFPLTITTTSGKNVGSVYVLNYSGVYMTISGLGPPLTILVPPYSWACIPINRPSGSFSITGVTLRSDLAQLDSIFIAWSDTDYTLPFPTGAGALPNPITQPIQAVSLGTTQFTLANGAAGAGPVTLLTIPAMVASQPTRYAITWSEVMVKAGAASANAAIQASRGFDGSTGIASTICFAQTDLNLQVLATRNDPVIVTNLDAVNPNIIQLVGGGTVGLMSGTISGHTL